VELRASRQVCYGRQLQIRIMDTVTWTAAAAFLRSNADCTAVLLADVRCIGGTAKWEVLNMANEYIPRLNTIAAFDSKRNCALRKKRLYYVVLYSERSRRHQGLLKWHY
jgi:hypothetical protein